MNEQHLRLCASAEWAQLVEDELLPWVLDAGTDLGDDLLEIGAGPGLVTDLLVRRALRVTAVEIDAGLVARLERAGFTDTVVEHDGNRFRFVAPRLADPRRPGLWGSHHRSPGRSQPQQTAAAAAPTAARRV